MMLERPAWAAEVKVYDRLFWLSYTWGVDVIVDGFTASGRVRLHEAYSGERHVVTWTYLRPSLRW